MEKADNKIWSIRPFPTCNKSFSIIYTKPVSECLIYIYRAKNIFIYQGCILSPTLFAMFIDVPVQDINLAQLRVNCQTCTLSTLLYADDIVLLAPSTENLLGLINVVAEWCINL